jgi:hypothetical protein
LQVALTLKVAVFRTDLASDATLRRALAALPAYAAEDPAVTSLTAPSAPGTTTTGAVAFRAAVGAEVAHLAAMAASRVRLHAFRDDPDALADAHARIARAALNAPALRLVTLQTLQSLYAKARDERAVSIICRATLLTSATHRTGRTTTGPSWRTLTCMRRRSSARACA